MWEGKREKVELSQNLELLKYRFEHRLSTHEEARDDHGDDAVHAGPVLKDIVRKRSLLVAEIEDLERQIAGLREASRLDRRMDAIGGIRDTFLTADGREFHQVSITGIDDLGVSIRHQDGAARIRIWDLDGGQREDFALDEDSASEAERRESRERIAYEEQIVRVMAAAENAKVAATAGRTRDTRARASRAAAVPVVANFRPLSQPATPFGRGASSGYRYGCSRRHDRPPGYTYMYDQPVGSALCVSRVFSVRNCQRMRLPSPSL